MEITPQSVVALTWTLKDAQGETLDDLDEPVDFLLGSGDLLPAIEAALQGHEPGAELHLNLEPEQAFGDYDEQLVYLAPRASLPEGIEEGMLIEASALGDALTPAPAGDTLLTITDIYPEHVVLDANHPLAGMALRLHLHVAGVREATAEEQVRGTAGTGFFRLQPPAPGGQSMH